VGKEKVIQVKKTRMSSVATIMNNDQEKSSHIRRPGHHSWQSEKGQCHHAGLTFAGHWSNEKWLVNIG